MFRQNGFLVMFGVAALGAACGGAVDPPVKGGEEPLVILGGDGQPGATAQNDQDQNDGAGASETRVQSLYESGTRYKARVHHAPGGAQSPAGWYDSELMVDCMLSRHDEGTRCLPATEFDLSTTSWDYVFANGGRARLGFSDPRCGGAPDVVAFDDLSCSTASPGDLVAVRVSETAAASCGGEEVRVVELKSYARIGDRFGGHVYFKSGSECVSDGAVFANQLETVVALAEIPVWQDEILQ